MANNIGWGKAHENNSIDFGAASDATNDFGSIYDSSESGETVIIGGKGPENTVLPAITGTAERGEVLTCSTGTWTGTGTITYSFQWQRNGVDIVAATSSTYTLVTADDNAIILCTVTATDDEGSRSANSNSVLSLGAPFNLVAPTVSGTEQVGETLTTTNGTWQGVATITFAYQWRRDSVNIGSATSSTYTLVAADYDTNIDCVITAANSLDSTDQASNSTGAIAGISPTISGVPTFIGTENVGEDLTAVFASSSGTPTPTDSIQWQRSSDGVSGWTDISGATSLVYTLILADEGNYVRPVQTSTNAEGSDTANGAASGQIQPELTAIYGLAFDGVNDLLDNLVNITLIGDFSIIVGANFDSITSGTNFSANSNQTDRLEFRGSNDMRFRNGTSGIQPDSPSNYIIPNEFHAYEFQRVGSVMNWIRDDVLLGTSSMFTEDFQIRSLMARRTGSNAASANGIEYFDLDGTVLNDSNSWGGWTIEGAARVESSDDGETWTPAP